MEILLISSCTEATTTCSSVTNGISFIARLLTILGGSYQYSYRYWKWGPLFFAFIYAFSNLASRISLRHHPISSLSKPLPSHQPTATPSEHEQDADSSSDDEDIDACSEKEEEEEEELEQDCRGRDNEADDNMREQSGAQSSWRSRWGSVGEGLSELLGYNGVVKLWDSSSSSSSNNGEFSWNLDAKRGRDWDNWGKIEVSLWDTRVSRRGRPAALCEWRTPPGAGSVGEIGVGEDDKVYSCMSSDQVEEFVWDLRMFHLPLIHGGL